MIDTLGVLLELLYHKAAMGLARRQSSLSGGAVTPGERGVRAVVRDSVEAVMMYGGASEESRTILDALIPLAGVLTSPWSLPDGEEDPSPA
mmetsp:Transcript_4678/g.13182  ORF Transcript_4678/g.13182 Transcript_4678/m.13182 type:complete len:91 (+) Transcript_4678:1902-2174(+)